MFTVLITLFTKKKVLLHERKRYTARRIASTRSAALSPDGRGYSHPVPMGVVGGGTPIQSILGDPIQS